MNIYTAELPCEQCITLAACISKSAIECQNLYTWLCSYYEMEDENSFCQIDLGGKCWNHYRVGKLEERFNRKVMHLMRENYGILFGRKN